MLATAIALLLQQPALALTAEPPWPFSALRQPGIPLLMELLALCRAVGASPRKLAYCFQDVLGMSPARYLRLMRLTEQGIALWALSVQVSCAGGRHRLRLLYCTRGTRSGGAYASRLSSLHFTNFTVHGARKGLMRLKQTVLLSSAMGVGATQIMP